MILTSERLSNLDTLAEMLKGLIINYTGYYNSYKNDADGNISSNPKIATHTSDGKKRKVTKSSNVNLHQTLLINRTLPITTTAIDPRIPHRVTTCGETPHAHMMPTIKEVITDAACSSARILYTPGNISRTGRDGTTIRDRKVPVRSPQENGPFLIGGTTVSRFLVNMEIRDTKKFNTSIDRNFGL